jgi:hypothetical protein
VASVEEVSFLAPFKFYRDEARQVTVRLTFEPAGNGLMAQGRLLGHRQLPGQQEPQETVHFTARVRLAPQAAEEGSAEVPEASEPAVGPEEIYRIYFHGPAYQVLEKAWRSGQRVVGLMPEQIPDDHQPAAASMVLDPRLIELCLQTAGTWELGTAGRMGLPRTIGRLRPLGRGNGHSDGHGRLYAVVEPDGDGGFDAYVVDDAGRVCLALEDYRTVELPGGVESEQLAPLTAVFSEGEKRG